MRYAVDLTSVGRVIVAGELILSAVSTIPLVTSVEALVVTVAPAALCDAPVLCDQLRNIIFVSKSTVVRTDIPACMRCH